ncbi:MAG: bifunctional demethylmenaquinone methyltransferase/2-methoxy-6-polyprenyl-1,4-benzoquinol methylase UbiE [Beijerinckiaceae bacterium]
MPTTDHETLREGAQSADFGFRRVPLGEKQGMVDDVFEKVASRYDLMNDLMSAGVHRAWKDILASKTGVSRNRPFRHIDVAGGSGDVAFRIADLGGARTDISVVDINPDMLEEGRKRAARRHFAGRIDFQVANAEELLAFPDNTFDAYTIAFGIRNVPRREKALCEAYRVLKRGGRFLCLEFSEVDMPLLDEIYKAYSFTVIPAVGKVVTGDGQPYRYLVESIAKFPDAESFEAEVAAAGFARTGFTRLSGGIVAIHSGWKL